jgi:predicted RNase H-like nuclease (RuvC/YqgF family)
MPQNYLVKASQFGRYVRGDVVPGYEVTAGHDAAFLVERGVVAPTDRAVTVEVVPKAPAAAAVPDDVYAERNRLFAENAGLREDLERHAGRAAELERHRDALKAEIGRYVETNAHLAAACEEHQQKIEQLTAELEAATAPAAPATD